MEEINNITTESYFGNSNEDKVIKTKNEILRYLEENLSNSLSEFEVDLKNLCINKYKKRNKILNQKPILDINTMESIRISHSLVKSENSQSLSDIINNPLGKEQTKLRNENFLNQTLKFRNSNTIMENESSLSSNTFFDYNHYKDNIVEQNSLVYIKSYKKNDLYRKNILELNENFFNDNTKIQNINNKDDSNDINNKYIKKNKIGNIFNKVPEEKIKLINKDFISAKEILRECDCLKNKNKIKKNGLSIKIV